MDTCNSAEDSPPTNTGNSIYSSEDAGKIHQKREHFTVLDSLRGLCAIIVVLYHFPVNSHIGYSGFVRGGYMFVDFFFVLSGFVISYSYGKRINDRESLLTFILRRFFRIWPLHLFLIALYVVIELVMMRPGAEMGAVSGRTFPDLLRTLTMTNSFGMDHNSAWNVPAWSISAEWWTYIVFALLVLMLPRSLAAGLSALVALSFAAMFFTHRSISITFDMGIIRCFTGFGLGALVATYWPRIASRLAVFGPRKLAIMEILVVLAIVGLVSNAQSTAWSFMAPFLFAFAVAIFAMEAGPVSAVMKWRFFVRAGLLSYSIYMVHQFVLGRLRNAADVGDEFGLRFDQGNAWHMDALTAIMLVSVGLTAYFTYRLVELPGQALGARLARRIRRHPQPA